MAKNENLTPIQEANKTKPEIPLPSAFSLFKPSFNAVMVNVWTFLGLILAPFTVFFIVSAMSSASNAPEGLAGLILIVAYIGSLLVYPAIPYVQLQSAQGKEVAVGEALKVGLKHFWRFYGLSILAGVVILLGFLLFIVPGLFMMRRYMLAQYYLYDRNLGIIESMKQSATDSKQFSGAIWGLIGVSILISLPSIIPVIGWIATAALFVTYYCAAAIRYFQIKNAAKTT